MKKTNTAKSGERLGKKKPSSLLEGGKATTPIMVNFLKTLKIELPYDPVVRLLEMYPKNSASDDRDLEITLVDGPLRKAGMWTGCLPTGEQMRKMWYTDTILVSHGEIQDVPR